VRRGGLERQRAGADDARRTSLEIAATAGALAGARRFLGRRRHLQQARRARRARDDDSRAGDPAGHRGAYGKLRERGSIDFPLLGVAVRLELDAEMVPVYVRRTLQAAARREGPVHHV
jgi:hypothetical protein